MPPRPVSGSGAAASSRGCPRRRRCRADRRSPAPRRGAACRGSARSKHCAAAEGRDGLDGIRLEQPRDLFERCGPPSCRGRPPPKAALMATGTPYSRRMRPPRRRPSPGRGAGHQRRLGARGDVARGHLVAQIADGLRAGPIQINPASMTAWAKSAFSERNPYPGGSRWHPTWLRRRGSCRSPGRTPPRSAHRGRRVSSASRTCGRRRPAGVHRDAGQTWRPGRPDHLDRDLTAVGDEDLGNGGHCASRWVTL